jgi:hypothetical protein
MMDELIEFHKNSKDPLYKAEYKFTAEDNER